MPERREDIKGVENTEAVVQGILRKIDSGDWRRWLGKFIKSRILIVEDDESINDLAVITLTDEGYQADGAPNAEEALIKLNKMMVHEGELPGLILLDLCMPGRGGVWLARIFKKEIPEMPIVIFTAVAQAGAENINGSTLTRLSKPFDIDDMLGIVRMLSVNRERTLPVDS